ncbi:hypothetical protein TNCV_2115391 [Trichonephila clavipes]|nr:hypothetical protein TNCV_2115391 [Trichonephila clavipes]
MGQKERNLKTEISELNINQKFVKELGSVRDNDQQPMMSKTYCVYLKLMILGSGVNVQMFRSCGQSDAKPSVFSSQGSLVLIYRFIEEIKG